MALQDEIDAFHKQMRARALLIAIEWAGSASRLGEMIGYSRYAGATWSRRVYITPTAAALLEALPGFPVKASELTIGVRTEPRTKRFQCPHCTKDINPPRQRTGYSSSFNDMTKRLRKAEAAKRKKAKQQAAKAKPKAPKREPS